MIAFYIIISLFIAWIWVDYYRLIDIYNSNKLIYVILTFILGCCSVFIVFGFHLYFPELFLIQQNGEMLNDFLYFTIEIGVLEEFAKLIPFLLMYFIFRKEFKEPIDYVAFIAISALGFSAVENTMYFNNYGPEIISGRAILSSVGHMFDTVLIAYGIILYKFHPKHKSILFIPAFFLLAAISHGIYDFWLSYEGGWIVTVFYFLITISWFALILNNAVNNSHFFDYKKVINPTKVAMRLLSYYGVVILLELIVIAIQNDVEIALNFFVGIMYSVSLIILVTCVRLSRFKLIKGRWFPFKIEVPFSVTTGDPLGMKSSYFRLQIKGDGYDEATIAPFYKEFVYVYPISSKRTFIGRKRLAFIEKISFLKNDEVFYLIKIFETDQFSPFELLLIKPKNTGETYVNDKYPIVAMFDIAHLEDWNNPIYDVKKFKFREWGYLKLK